MSRSPRRGAVLAACATSLWLAPPASSADRFASDFEGGVAGFSAYKGKVSRSDDAHGGQGSLVWRYQRKAGELNFVARDVERGSLAGREGFRLAIKSDRGGPLILQLREQDESSYQHMTPSLGSGWQVVAVRFDQFQRDPDVPDENGVLDLAQVTELWIIDASGFAGERGARTVWIDDLQLLGSGSSAPAEARRSAGVRPEGAGLALLGIDKKGAKAAEKERKKAEKERKKAEKKERRAQKKGGKPSGAEATAASSGETRMAATRPAAAATSAAAFTKLDAEVLPAGPASAVDNLKSDPAVIRADGVFHMWYGGNRTGGGQQIYYATSTDGESWQKHGAVLKLGGRGAWDRGDIETPSVVKVGDTFHMYYCGRAVAEDRDDWSEDTAYKIGHATSTDGKRWTKDPRNPILGLGKQGRNDWNWAAAAEPSVLYTPGKGFEMWYVGINILGGTAHGHVGYATSQDGSRWKEYADNPVIASKPGPDDIEYNGYFTPCVVKDDRGYKMFYVTDTYRLQPSGPIRVATSSDGIDWRLDRRRLFGKGRSGGWKATGVFAPAVVAEPDGYHVFYTGFTVQGLKFGIGYQRLPKDEVDPG